MGVPLPVRVGVPGLGVPELELPTLNTGLPMLDPEKGDPRTGVPQPPQALFVTI